MKTDKIAVSAGLWLSASLLLAGCSTTVNTAENEQKVGHADTIPIQRVVTDSALGKRVTVRSVNVVITSGGLLKPQVELLNETSSLHRFLYHFEWFDSSGMQVNNALSAPVPEQIEGRETKFIYGIAPNPDCKDFRLKLISAE